MATTLKSEDKVSIVKTTGGDKQEFYPISELNELISTEEDERLTDLETAVGTYAGDADLSTDVADLMDNTLRKMPASEIDLSAGTGTADYEVGADDVLIVVTETDGTDYDINLPAATGSGRNVIISIQHANNSIVINPDGTDTINLGSDLTLAALSTAHLLDYAAGKWIVI